MSDCSPLSQAVIEGDWDKAVQLTAQEAKAGREPQEIIGQDLRPAMDVVGQKFSSGEYFLPDMLMAGRAMTRAMRVLQPFLADSSVSGLGKVVIGTVEGDVHDIGKNMVIMFLRGAGFEVTDLGSGIPAEKFVEVVQNTRPDILGMSALLTTTMPNLGSTIKALEAAGVRQDVKVIIGGAPVSQDYANHVGADAYGHDAGQAARICKTLLQS